MLSATPAGYVVTVEPKETNRRALSHPSIIIHNAASEDEAARRAINIYRRKGNAVVVKSSVGQVYV